MWSITFNMLDVLKKFYDLEIKAIDCKSQKKRCSREEERLMLNIDFGGNPDKFKGEYLDMCEGIQSEILSIMKFDENSDLSTTYLGKVGTNKSKYN